MESPDDSFQLKRKGKRLLKPVESEVEITEELEYSQEETSIRNFETKKKSNKVRPIPSNGSISHVSRKKEKNRGGAGVLSALINSFKEEDTQILEDSESESTSELNEQFKISKLKMSTRKRKKKCTESIDLSNLLSSLENKDLKRSSKSNKDLDSMFESFSIPSSCSESDSDSIKDNFNFENEQEGEKMSKDIQDNASDEDFELLNLTEIEIALKDCVKDDYNPSLKLNEWLPSQCIDVRSEIAREMDDDVQVKEITERHEFFYSQWIDQIGYLFNLTKGFTRTIQDCFVREGQILSVSNLVESKPELLLDPQDKILVSVQNSDGCVVLNRLVNIANSQEKLLNNMSKETGLFDIEENDSKTRLKYGVLSLKARTKLWWFCRMAEHCGLIGREGSNIIKYYIQESNKKKASNSLFSTNANIISSIDPTMELFNQNDSDSENGDGSYFSGDENRDDYGETEKMNEIDSKWSDLSLIKVSDKVRPWERRAKNIEAKSLETNSQNVQESTLNNSKKELFKFMLKNIGPRPVWTNKSIIGEFDSNQEPLIEIEPPANLSIREQGQLKIKWLQMKSQAEKLATNHFKIMNPETKDLDHESLRYWCKLFKVNLLFPPSEDNKITKTEKIQNTCQSKASNNNITPKELLPETNNDQKDDESENITKRNSLPLDVEFASDLSGSDIENGQENKSYDSEIDIKEISQAEISNVTDNDIIMVDDTNEYHSAEEVIENEPSKVSESEKEEEIHQVESEENSVDEENLEIRKEAYRKLKAIRKNRIKFKKKMMEKYGHLFEDEAEESDDDGIKILKRGMDGNDEDDDDDDEMDWDELSGFSDFIDDNNYENEELDGDAIQAHLKHMKQIEEKQYRQLFTLEGIKERKNKVYGFASNQDDGIDGETRLEKKRNEMLFNSAFFDDDVISEFWTDEEELADYEEEIDERNLTEMLGLDYEEWQSSLPKKVNSLDESLNEQRKIKYNILKDSLIKEASSSINILKQKLKSIQAKLNVDDNVNVEDKSELQSKYVEYIEKLKKLLHSIHIACNKCIYENSQFFDHIDIYEYIQKRQESRQQKKANTKNSQELNFKNKIKHQNNYLRENVNRLNKTAKSVSDSEDEMLYQKKVKKHGRNVVNVKGGRFMISKK